MDSNLEDVVYGVESEMITLRTWLIVVGLGGIASVVLIAVIFWVRIKQADTQIEQADTRTAQVDARAQADARTLLVQAHARTIRADARTRVAQAEARTARAEVLAARADARALAAQADIRTEEADARALIAQAEARVIRAEARTLIAQAEARVLIARADARTALAMREVQTARIDARIAQENAQKQIDYLEARVDAMSAEAASQSRQASYQRVYVPWSRSSLSMVKKRKPRPTPEDLVRYARRAAPFRLGSGELDLRTGKISWPGLLRANEFTSFRAELELICQSGEADEVYSTIQAMKAELRQHIHQVAPMQYAAAQHFIKSLEYEISLMGKESSLDSVAAPCKCGRSACVLCRDFST